MIAEEYLSETRVRHYSDSGLMIRQNETGNVYEDAVDAVPCRYTYSETDEPVPSEETIKDKAEAYDILTGVSN